MSLWVSPKLRFFLQKIYLLSPVGHQNLQPDDNDVLNSTVKQNRLYQVNFLHCYVILQVDRPIKYCVLSKNLHTRYQLENYYSVFREEILDFHDIKFEYILTFCPYMSITMHTNAYYHVTILFIQSLFPLIEFFPLSYQL